MTETGTQTKNRTEEIRRLQNCINDLVSLLALPAIWTGREPPEIVTILLDALSGLLRLEFIYARLEDSGAPFEAVRTAGQQADLQPTETGRRLAEWLDSGAEASARLVPDPFGNGELTIVSCRLGLEEGTGIIVAGARRPDFPDKADSLLLKVAAAERAPPGRAEAGRKRGALSHHRQSGQHRRRAG